MSKNNNDLLKSHQSNWGLYDSYSMNHRYVYVLTQDSWAVFLKPFSASGKIQSPSSHKNSYYILLVLDVIKNTWNWSVHNVNLKIKKIHKILHKESTLLGQPFPEKCFMRLRIDLVCASGRLADKWFSSHSNHTENRISLHPHFALV